MYYKKEIIVRGESFDIDDEVTHGLSIVVTPRKCRANNKHLDINMGSSEWYSSTRGEYVILNLRHTRQNHIQFLIDNRLTRHSLEYINHPLINDYLKGEIREAMEYLNLEGMTLEELLTSIDN